MKKSTTPTDISTRKTRSDKGYPQLTQRDEETLRLIGEQTACRFDQLQALLARHPESRSHDPDVLSETRTREVIERWKALGLVTYQKIYYDTPGWICLTQKGLYHSNLSFRFLDPRHADLEHLFWINETRVLVEKIYGSCPGFQWESERQYHVTRERFKAQQKQDPDLEIPWEYRGNHLPDAVLRYRLKEEPEALTITSAIEVELSEKAYATWKKIFLELIRFFTYTHYYVDPSIKSTFTKALNKFQNEDPVFDEPNKKQRQYIYIHDLKHHT